MKIAIQGHPTRGEEVIQILESLGGKNIKRWYGNGEMQDGFFINNDGIIEFDNLPKGYKLYTLEEFEKEFPFKIGDKVQTTPYGEPAEVIKMYLNPACGIAYKVRYKSGVELQHCPENLKFYKEMQKERNITLTLDKAKEWYKKGGELKEVALQAFTEKELTKVDLPKTWKEFCRDYPVQKGECWFESGDKIEQTLFFQDRKCKNWIPSKESAKAHLALIQLEQLRDCWRQGWKPDEFNNGYCIVHYPARYVVMSFGFTSLLSFPTKKMAEEFLECFKDLIEKAGDLI